jgi:hypothetical protein
MHHLAGAAAGERGQRLHIDGDTCMCSGGGGGNPVLTGDSLDRSRMGGCEQQKSSISSSIRRNAASREREEGMRHRGVAIEDDWPTRRAALAAVV